MQRRMDGSVWKEAGDLAERGGDVHMTAEEGALGICMGICMNDSAYAHAHTMRIQRGATLGKGVLVHRHRVSGRAVRALAVLSR